MVKIYNTLTRQKEDFVPLDPAGKRVNMYTCGVTVYDRCHIGHARSLYVFDVIRRYLTWRGYDVHFVRNITDVDDKIIKRAQEMGITSEEVARRNIDEYQGDLRRLGVFRDEHEPRATDPENIAGMIEFIEGLIARGAAYEAGGNVYFHVRSFEDYGKLSGQSIDMMQEAVRIDRDEHKKDILDFALWKRSKSGEPSWESPWGSGRPGWHIECSCMSLRHLGCETLDIHGGGRDLVFPHHENEVAQSESFTGKPFARYWIHHGLLTIDRQKMSKSLGNFITIADAIDRYGADDLKVFFLSAHYASTMDFSEAKMAEVRKQREYFENFLGRCERAAGQAHPTVCGWMARHDERFTEAMDDDFNTAKALGVVFEFIVDVNKFLDQKEGQAEHAGIVAGARDLARRYFFDLFNLSLSGAAEGELPEAVQSLVRLRSEARARRDFAESDRLRDLLREQGYEVKDTKEGQTCRRI